MAHEHILYAPELMAAVERWSGIPGSPSNEARKHPKGIRVFKNPILEYVLGRAHWTVPGFWVIPLSVYMFSQGLDRLSLGANVALVVAGILFWTLLEYWLHSYWFHLHVDKAGPSRKLFQFMVHGYHHEYPSDPWRLVMPVTIAWPIAAVVASILRLLVGGNAFWSVFTGVMLGYLAYDWVHYYTHHFRPKGGIGKYLREYHLVHHFANSEANFGISSPLWDWVTGRSQAPGASRPAANRPMGSEASTASSAPTNDTTKRSDTEGKSADLG